MSKTPREDSKQPELFQSAKPTRPKFRYSASGHKILKDWLKQIDQEVRDEKVQRSGRPI